MTRLELGVLGGGGDAFGEEGEVVFGVFDAFFEFVAAALEAF